MRCGKCKGDHDTVSEVRSCFGVPDFVVSTARPTKVSPGQRSLAHALARERKPLPEYEGEQDENYHQRIEGMDLDGIREFLDKMLKQPYLQVDARQLFEKLENSKYALETDGDIRFYEVTGKAIRRLYELTGAPGDFRSQRIYRPVKILSRIAEDSLAALALFGQNVGRCGRCGSPLTKKHTRERGIGDDCYAKTKGA